MHASTSVLRTGVPEDLRRQLKDTMEVHDIQDRARNLLEDEQHTELEDERDSDAKAQGAAHSTA
jgi:hypothetical protein